MRWLYLDPRNPCEAAYHESTLRQIDAWWREFVSLAPRLRDVFTKRTDFDLPAWMHQHLAAIDKRLMWEFGPAVNGDGHRLVITTESERGLRPLLGTILERAPILPDWEFYGYRMPVSVDVAKLAVEGRTGGSLAGVLVEARIGEGQCIDLVFRSPEFRETKHELADSVAFVATETLLGEELLDCWIGVIATAPLPKAGWLSKLRGGEGTRALPLERLRPTVLALIGSLIDQLPDQPCHTLLGEDSNWSLVELQPDDQDDYVERTDLCVAVTGRLEMWKAAHSGGIFHSGRFSRHGETFCYLKLDGSQGLGDSPFADRGDIEDALNDALRPTALGCVVGGGTGRRYSYIDLALTDCALAVPLIRDTLQSGRVPHRTWLQFFDDEFSKEWVGIYDDSPPPPL